MITLVEQWLANPASIEYKTLLANKNRARTTFNRAKSKARKEVTKHAFFAADMAESSAFAELMGQSVYAAKFRYAVKKNIADFHKSLSKGSL